MPPLVIPLYFALQLYWNQQPLQTKWSTRLNWQFLSSEEFSLVFRAKGAQSEMRSMEGCALNKVLIQKLIQAHLFSQS